MKERPILFSAPMVKAILAGTKTQTRRLYKPRRGDDVNATGGPLCALPSPFGSPGDLLWVRETHAQFAVGNRTGLSPQCVAYRATCDEEGAFDYVNNGDEIMRIRITKWTPSIFMPRLASRITLEITEIRVQRLQDISEDDALAEGCEPRVTLRKVYPSKLAADVERRSYRDGFADLWESINGERAPWSSNCWVWAVTFRRLP